MPHLFNIDYMTDSFAVSIQELQLSPDEQGLCTVFIYNKIPWPKPMEDLIIADYTHPCCHISLFDPGYAMHSALHQYDSRYADDPLVEEVEYDNELEISALVSFEDIHHYNYGYSLKYRIPASLVLETIRGTREEEELIHGVPIYSEAYAVPAQVIDTPHKKGFG